jgi:hypothetical protein
MPSPPTWCANCTPWPHGWGSIESPSPTVATLPPHFAGGGSVRSRLMSDISLSAPGNRMPRWVWKAVAVFWGWARGARHPLDSWAEPLRRVHAAAGLAVPLARHRAGRQPLATRGWRRGTATAVILVGVLVAFLVFVVAIGALVGQQIADLLGNSEKYVTRTVNFLNDNFGAHINAEQVIKRRSTTRRPGAVASSRVSRTRWSTCRSRRWACWCRVCR